MGYWFVAILLFTIGILGLMSIGIHFLAVAVGLLCLAPVRHRPRIFRPALVGIVAFSTSAFLIEPMYCTASTSSSGGDAATSCSSVLGVSWPAVSSGLADWSGDLAIAWSVALAVAAIATLTVAVFQAVQPARPPGSGA